MKKSFQIVSTKSILIVLSALKVGASFNQKAVLIAK